MTNDGATKEDHAASAAEQWAKLGKKPPADLEEQDDAPELPGTISYLWDAYEQIRLGCSFDDYGGPLLTWEAILAWCQLVGPPLMSWEVNALIYVGQTAKAVAATAAVERMKKIK